MDRDASIVIHGFLALPNREKMQVVEAINEYFDSTKREEVRSQYDEQFTALEVIPKGIECKCCGRQ